jgi:hypothetical protein
MTTATVNVQAATLSAFSAAMQATHGHDKKVKALVKAGETIEQKRSAAYDSLYADGVRPDHLLKRSETFNAEVFGQIESAIKAAIFNKAELTLVNLSHDEAKSRSKADDRIKLTRLLSKYVGNVCSALQRRIDELNPKAETAKAKGSKAQPTAVADTAPSGNSKEVVKGDIAGITPAKSREAFIEALNAMIIATNLQEDKLIKKNASAFIKMFSAMAATLAA